ncbi:MAG: Mu transposase C-terminal domain-containing protein [Desulfobulbaceae bacterium]|nr:Mu transposase C-terminal domain-containing protein [Desulfobulbaceae bacterium]
MNPTYSANELAELLGKTARSVSRQADADGWKYVWKKGRGGRAKAYLSKMLPESTRIAIARQDAVSPPTGTGHGLGVALSPQGGAVVGALHGTTIAQDAAESAERARINRERGLVAFNQLPAERQAEAEARLEILMARNAFIAAAGLPLKRGSQLFCTEYIEGNLRLPTWITGPIGPTLSWSTLNRWQQSYDDAGLAGLANGYRSPNKGKTTLTPQQRAFVKGLLTEHPHISLIKIGDAMAARFNGQTPHISSVRRYVKAWTAKHGSLLLYMSNPDAWKNKHQFALGDASEQVERLNQVWEFDSTPADIMLKDGRFAVIGVVDVYSRRPKLLVSPSSRSTAVAALTRRAIIDWGVPEVAKTDNGADYVSKHMVRVFEALDIEQKLCPPFTPESKPHIERFFKTFSHDIVELLPGYIGHSVADRKAIEARRSFADRLMRRGGDPVEIKQLTADELQTICDRWCRAIYEQNPHAGLQDRKPADVARAWTRPVRRITNERALDVLLSEAPSEGGLRTVTKKGIRVDNVGYIAPEMAGYEGKKVRVLLDSTDLGTIFLFDAESGEFVCTAVDPIRTGHDRAEIASRTRERQKTIMREGSKELKRNARVTATRDIHMEILEHREAQIADIIDLPKPANDYTTPALGEAARAVLGREQAQQNHDDMAELIDELAAERHHEAVVVKKKAAAGIVPIFASATERYQWIRDRVRSGKMPSGPENEFLGEFYATRAGRMYLDLEGDLRGKAAGMQAAE